MEKEFGTKSGATHELIHTAFRYSYAIEQLIYYIHKMEEINKAKAAKPKEK